ncbi:MAG: ribbon-helix-helix protein, CopG family [Firmicutes bacterium]|nr:ribbon-helix-helix protein, CopG family [Bacillota bacterium]
MAFLTVRDLPDDVYDALKAEARASGRSLASVVRDALSAHAEEYRQRLRLRDALRTLEAFHDAVLRRRGGVATSDSTDLVRDDRR